MSPRNPVRFFRFFPVRFFRLGETPGAGPSSQAAGPPDRGWGYDSNAVRAALVEQGIEPIIPARDNNTVATHQDGRKLRRYKRRWLIERTHAWLQKFRRLVVRYEYSAINFLALVHVACALVTLKRVLG